jgi:hypothetical protein
VKPQHQGSMITVVVKRKLFDHKSKVSTRIPCSYSMLNKGLRCQREVKLLTLTYTRAVHTHIRSVWLWQHF